MKYLLNQLINVALIIANVSDVVAGVGCCDRFRISHGTEEQLQQRWYLWPWWRWCARWQWRGLLFTQQQPPVTRVTGHWSSSPSTHYWTLHNGVVSGQRFHLLPLIYPSFVVKAIFIFTSDHKYHNLGYVALTLYSMVFSFDSGHCTMKLSLAIDLLSSKLYHFLSFIYPPFVIKAIIIVTSYHKYHHLGFVGSTPYSMVFILIEMRLEVSQTEQ